MKFSSEARIGLIGLMTILVIIWGINFLKGRNVLSNKNVFFAEFNDLQGMEASASIVMDGFKIGTVKSVSYDPERSPRFVLALETEKKYPIAHGSRAEIYSADLLGTKAIRIVPAVFGIQHERGDTLTSGVAPDILSTIIEQVTPVAGKIEALTVTLDSVAMGLLELIEDESLARVVSNIESASADIKEQLGEKGKLDNTLQHLEAITGNIHAQKSAISTAIVNISEMSTRLNSPALDSTLRNLGDVSTSLRVITGELEQGKGSLGKLLYNDSLYDHLTSVSARLDSLLKDLKDHPERYVQFSVF